MQCEYYTPRSNWRWTYTVYYTNTPLRNQTKLAAPAISVSTTHYSSQYFLTMNIPMLISKLTALETKMCGKMMVITSYFKDELQLIAIAIDQRYCPKKTEIRA